MSLTTAQSISLGCKLGFPHIAVHCWVST